MTSKMYGKMKPVLCLFLALGAISPVALAQVPSTTTPTVSLTAQLPESVSISTNVNSISWSSLTPGASTTAGSTLAITTNWVLATNRVSVELDAYFSNASQALASGGNHIPSSAVFGAVSGADTHASTAFTGTPSLGTAGAGLMIFTHSLSSDFSSSRSDTLTLSINLSSLAIPAGTYTGTLNLVAQAL